MDEHLHVYLLTSKGTNKCVWKGCDHTRTEPIERAWAA